VNGFQEQRIDRRAGINDLFKYFNSGLQRKRLFLLNGIEGHPQVICCLRIECVALFGIRLWAGGYLLPSRVNLTSTSRRQFA